MAGGEPSRNRAVLSAGLLAATQSGRTAIGLGPAAGQSRAEQDRSTASRQPGSCLPVFAKSSGTGASLLPRGRLQVYSCLNSGETTFDAISTAHSILPPDARSARLRLSSALQRKVCQCWSGRGTTSTTQPQRPPSMWRAWTRPSRPRASAQPRMSKPSYSASMNSLKKRVLPRRSGPSKRTSAGGADRSTHLSASGFRRAPRPCDRVSARSGPR